MMYGNQDHPIQGFVFTLPVRKPKQEEKGEKEEKEDSEKNEVSLVYIEYILQNEVFHGDESSFYKESTELLPYYQDRYTECPAILIEHARRFPSYLQGRMRVQAFFGTLYELMVLRLRELMIQFPRSTIPLDKLSDKHWRSLYDWAVDGVNGAYFEYATLCVIRIVYCASWSSGIYESECTISDVFDFAVRLTKTYGTNSPCYASDLLVLWKKLLGHVEWKRKFVGLFSTNEPNGEWEEKQAQNDDFPAAFMALLNCPVRSTVTSVHPSHPVIENFRHVWGRLCIEFMYATLFTGSDNIRDQAILFWPFLITPNGEFMTLDACCSYMEEENYSTKSARWTLNQTNAK
jgi:hypothetical protein